MKSSWAIQVASSLWHFWLQSFRKPGIFAKDGHQKWIRLISKPCGCLAKWAGYTIGQVCFQMTYLLYATMTCQQQHDSQKIAVDVQKRKNYRRSSESQHVSIALMWDPSWSWSVISLSWSAGGCLPLSRLARRVGGELLHFATRKHLSHCIPIRERHDNIRSSETFTGNHPFSSIRSDFFVWWAVLLEILGLNLPTTELKLPVPWPQSSQKL